MAVPIYNQKPDGKSGDVVDVLAASAVAPLHYDPTEPDGNVNLKAAQMCLSLLAGPVTGSASTQLSVAASGKFARCTSLTGKNTGTVRVAICDSSTAVFADGYPLEVGETFGGDLNPATLWFVPESGSFKVSLYSGKSST